MNLNKSIKEINELLKKKVIKPSDLVKEALENIKKNNLNAFITINENALEEAYQLDDKPVDNILFGIPIAIKDNIVTKDIKTSCASLMLDNFIPIYDATVIKKIKEKNMIIIGKTNMDEFAMGSSGETSYYKPTLNPWNENKVPGGSSSGSACCVSSRMVPLALGSDTGGSIRQPASFCGVVGLKPTYGRISRYGLIAFASSLDVIGPITRNVYENALLLNILAGHDDNDYTSSFEDVLDYTSLIGKDVKNLKIAVPNYYMSEVIDEGVRNKVKEVLDILKKEGLQVDYIDIPYLEYSIPLYQVIALGECSSNLARFDGIKYGHQTSNYTDITSLYKRSRQEGFGDEVKRRIMIGSYVLSGKNADIYYHKALCLRKQLTNSFEDVFKKYDLIIGPTNTNVAYDFNKISSDVLKSFYDDLLTNPVNLAGLPSLSLPIGFNVEKLPIGMQIIGNYYKEDVIYQLASFIEDKLKLNLDPKGGIKC